MNKKTYTLLLIPALLSVMSLSHAFRGGAGGGDFRGGGGDFHQNNGFHDNGNNFNRNNLNVNGDRRGNYWGVNPVNVPVVGYYSSQCQTVQSCDSSGQCVLQNACDDD